MGLGNTTTTATATAAATTKTTALNFEVFDNQRRQRIINFIKIELQELRFRCVVNAAVMLGKKKVSSKEDGSGSVVEGGEAEVLSVSNHNEESLTKKDDYQETKVKDEDVKEDVIEDLSKEEIEEMAMGVLEEVFQMPVISNDEDEHSKVEEPAKKFDFGKFTKPTPQLASLLIASKKRGPKGVNACGAIKVLTEKKTNRVALARTSGFVSSLLHAIENDNNSIVASISNDQSSTHTGDSEFEVAARAYGEAAERSLQALKNLSLEDENHELLFHSSKFMAIIISTLKDDCSKMRLIACQI